MNTLTGTAGNDQFQYSLSPTIAAYSIDGLAGNDRITLQVIGNSGANLLADANTLTGGDGNDRMEIRVENRYAGVDAAARNNTLFSTTGNNKVTMKVLQTSNDPSVGNAYASDNILVAGGHGGSLLLHAESRNGNVLLQDNLGTGVDRAELKVKSGIESVLLRNSIVGDDVRTNVSAGDDITLQENTLRGFDGKVQVKATADDSVSAIDNHWSAINFDRGQVKIDLKSTKETTGFVNATQNSIDGTGGTDRMDLKFQSKGNVVLFQNTIEGDSGNDNIKVKAVSNVDAALLTNIITGDNGYDKVLLDVRTKGDATVQQNTLDGVSRSNDVMLSVKSNAEALVEQNLISGAANGTDEDIGLRIQSKGRALVNSNQLMTDTDGDEDKLLLSIKSTGDEIAAVSNILIGGNGVPELEFAADAKLSSTIFGTSFFLNGDDFGEASLVSKSKTSFSVVEATSFVGSNQADILSIDAMAKTDAQIFGGLLQMGDGTAGEQEEVSLTANSKTGAATISMNTITGGADSQYIDLEVKGRDSSGITRNSIDSGSGNDVIQLDVSRPSAGGFLTNNTLLGGGGHDQIYLSFDGIGPVTGNEIDAGSGDDLIDIDLADGFGALSIDNFFSSNIVRGGTGFDTVRFSVKNQYTDILFGSDQLYDIEQIDLSKKSTLVIDSTNLIAITDSDNDLFVLGNGSNTVDLVSFPSWSSLGTVNMYGTDFNRYTNSGATIYVEDGISVL